MSLKKKKLKNQRPSNEVCVMEGVQNAANTLLANIRFSSVDEKLKVIVITSSVPNEGKTTVAVSLAIAAGRMGRKVILVEGDMRRRSLRGVLGVKPKHGIHALLTGKCTFQDVVIPTKYKNVDFLDAEAGIPNPDGILNSRHYDEMLEILRKHYDYVIIDTPPVTAFVDSAVIGSKADGVVLIARENYTDKREIMFAAEQLTAGGANLLGVSLNCQRESSSGYGYYYNYYYHDYKDDVEAKGGTQQSQDDAKPKSFIPKPSIPKLSGGGPVATTPAAGANQVQRPIAKQKPSGRQPQTMKKRS